MEICGLVYKKWALLNIAGVPIKGDHCELFTSFEFDHPYVEIITKRWMVNSD